MEQFFEELAAEDLLHLARDRLRGRLFAPFDFAGLAPSQRLLQIVELAPGFLQTGRDPLQLPLQQMFVIGDDHRAFLAEDLSLGPMGQAARQPWAGQSAELLQGNLQQVAMMGRHERADKVKALLLLGSRERGHGRLRIVALVKDEGDVLAPLGQLAITLRQFLGDGLKDGAVVDIAGVDLVEQRHMKVGADQKA